ncbi:glutathione S-transferase N-terminal domain-containing protein [Loktanella sp. TSTF-M6]|uniref:Glutathione S-transferase N-terminal domain-containing protein n=1 Tax=Loktanella gaetbuli TaxID=2881335 RepID=A0ABS8BST9_9RHOB|nr:glutathione S-transferase [Loktanella gaetbuli]MCB5198644.1 glutathione S-transferase N-terminal domain-containing protein [Loktanella gaetbuli]
MTIKLHCFGESGNAYKAALTLTLAEVEWEPVFVDFFKGGSRTPEFRALNVMGEVPVMVDGDMVLTQSAVIQDYITSKTSKLGAKSADQRREILRWMFFDNHKVSGIAGPLRFNMNFLPADKRSADVNDYLLMRLNSALKVMDTHLDGRDWLASDTLTIADIACAGYLYYEEPFGFDRTAFPNVDAWLDRLAATDGWKHPYDLMPRALPAA